MKIVHIRSQSGVALVFALLLLIVMTIIGLSAMSGSSMQERMAGNVNLQSLAFEASSAGIGQALAFGIAERDARNGCERGGDDVPWYGDFSDFTPVRLDPQATAVHDLDIQYRLKAECREDEDAIEDAEVPLPVQWFVISEGSVWSGNERLGIREIEVRLDDFRTDGLSGLRVEGTADIVFGGANSDNFTMDGKGGPAISAATQENAQTIVGEIGSDRIANYTGGVGTSQYPPPFNHATLMAQWALRIKAFMQHEGVGSTPVQMCGTYPEGYIGMNGENIEGDPVTMTYHSGDFTMGGGNTVEGVTYIAGDLKMSGNPSGTGMLIVEGDVDWRGTTDFNGFVVALGGLFDMSGGGQGSTRGMIYAANLDLATLHSHSGDPDYQGFNDIDFNGAWRATEIDPVTGEPIPSIYDQIGLMLDPATVGTLPYFDLYSGCNANNWPECLDSTSDDGFGTTTIDFDGGGGHSIEYDCELFDHQRQILTQCQTSHVADSLDPAAILDAPWLDAGCNTPGQGGSIQAIRSWREDFSGRSG